jgi:hypothetical protein
LADKTEVDLFRDGQPVTWEKPELGSRLYKNDRWRKYMMNLWLADYNAYRIYYGKYMCRKWNRDAKPGRQLMEFEIFFMLEQTVLPGQSTKIVKTSTWQHKCF